MSTLISLLQVKFDVWWLMGSSKGYQFGFVPLCLTYEIMSGKLTVLASAGCLHKMFLCSAEFNL